MSSAERPHVHAAFHNGGRGRWNAWFFDVFDRYINHVARRHKRHAFSGMSRGTTVELGAGTGANFDFLAAGSRLIAVEPNLAMHDRLRRNAASRPIDLELLAVSAEDIPLPDGSVDHVVASLLLCTVDNPSRVLAEVLRILRSGGTFHFVEHVAAPEATLRRWVQERIARPWAWLFEGCHTHRATAADLSEAGFSHLVVESMLLRHSLFYPVNTAISGIATK